MALETGPATGRRALLLGAGAALAVPALARAQAVQRTVRIIAGFPPGGQIDAVARLLAEALRGSYADSIVVENRPGAAGRLALETVKAAEPDGTTVGLTPSDHLVYFDHLYGDRLRYAPFIDFAAVAQVCEFYNGFATGPATPANTLAEFIAWAKGKPAVPFGIPGPGTLPHFMGIQFGKATGLPMQAVAYRGDGPSVQDLLAGQIPLSIASLGSLAPLATGTGMRVLAVGMPERAPLLPNVPTVGEAGFPAIAVGGFQVLVVPARTPTPLVAALDRAVGQAMAQPALREAIARIGLVPTYADGAGVAARMRAENVRWKPIVAESGFRPED